MADQKDAILLMISGGPDSATLAYKAEQARKAGDCKLHGIYLRSGHPSDDMEIQAANDILQRVGGTLEIIDISSTVAALGNLRIMIHSQAAIMRFGNGIALSIATAYAFQVRATKIMLGLHADDAEESAEYRQEFLDVIQSASSIVDGVGIPIEAPFLNMTKSEVFRYGLELGVDYGITWSCIRAGKVHCGQCGACRARRRAFNLCGATDPTLYSTQPLALETANSH